MQIVVAKPQTKSALNIANKALVRSQMRQARIMHVETDLLNCVGNISLVKVKYCKAPARLQNSVASATGAPSAAAIFGLVSKPEVLSLNPG